MMLVSNCLKITTENNEGKINFHVISKKNTEENIYDEVRTTRIDRQHELSHTSIVSYKRLLTMREFLNENKPEDNAKNARFGPRMLALKSTGAKMVRSSGLGRNKKRKCSDESDSASEDGDDDAENSSLGGGKKKDAGTYLVAMFTEKKLAFLQKQATLVTQAENSKCHRQNWERCYRLLKKSYAKERLVPKNEIESNVEEDNGKDIFDWKTNMISATV